MANKELFQTKIAEFQNKTGDLLRGILLLGGNKEKAVLMCGGFERSATTEKKFKALADRLIKNNISSLRFDFTGCGLSDGDFSKMTVEKMSEDLRSAIEFLKGEIEIDNIACLLAPRLVCLAK